MANTYDKGDKIRISATFQDANGTDMDPTTITVKHKKPDGTVITWVYGTDTEVVKDAVGKYHADITLDQSGTWLYRFEGTGSVVAAGEEVFHVRKSLFD